MTCQPDHKCSIEKWFWPVFGALAIAYWGMRLLTLFTAIEAVSWHEELAVGAMARELLLGLKTSYWNFQLDPYSGETLVIAPLISLSFQILGGHLIALKIVPLVLYFITVCTAAKFTAHYFDRVSALWTMFFLVFLPPILAAQTFIAIGGHTESLLITLILLNFFYAWLFSPNSRKKHLLLLGFGITGGFGFWFYYENGIAFAACLISWILISPKTFFSRRLLIVIGGFLIGFSPWIYTWVSQPLNGSQFLSIVFPIRPWPELFWVIPKRMFAVAFMSLPQAFAVLPESGFPQRFTASFYYGLHVLLAGGFFSSFLFWRKQGSSIPPKIVFFLVYPVLFLLVYGLTEMDIPILYSHAIIFRYYAPLFLILLMMSGIAARFFRKSFLVLLVLLSLFAQLRLFFKEPPAQGLRLKGYSYHLLGTYWAQFLLKSSDVPTSLNQIAHYVSEENSRLVYHGMINEFWSGFPFWVEPGSQLSIEENHQRISQNFQSLYLEESGSFLGVNYREKGGLSALLKNAGSIPNNLQPYFYKGILSDFYGFGAAAFLHDKALRDQVPEAHRHWGFFGIGKFFQINPLGSDELPAFYAEVDGFSLEGKRWYYRGVGSAVYNDYLLRMNAHEDMKRITFAARQKVPPAYLPDFFWGIGKALSLIYPEDDFRTSLWIRRLAPGYEREAFQGAADAQSWYSWQNRPSSTPS